MNKKGNRRLVLQSKYCVVVRYGNEKLEKCIEMMIEAKKRNMQTAVCSSPKDSL